MKNPFNNFNNSLLLVATLVGMMLFNSCQIFRKAPDPEVKEPVKPLPVMQSPPSAMHDAAARFGMITYGAQLMVNFGGTENSVNANIRIAKDSIVWISARKFGFEIGRIMLSLDSVWLMDRISNRYFAGDYAFFGQQFNLDVDYDMVEALLLGNPLQNWSDEPVETDCLVPGQCTIIYPSRYRVNQGRDGRARPEGSSVTRQEIVISTENARIMQNSVEVSYERRRIQAQYDQFTRVGEMLLPAIVAVNINDQGMETRLQIAADSFKTNEVLAFPFQIPRSYKPMDLR